MLVCSSLGGQGNEGGLPGPRKPPREVAKANILQEFADAAVAEEKPRSEGQRDAVWWDEGKMLLFGLG